MSVVVDVSARNIDVPHECACCAGAAEVQVPASYTRVTGVRVVRRDTRSQVFPYCVRCLDHARRWASAPLYGIALVVMGVVAVIIGVVSDFSAEANLAMFAAASVGGLMATRRVRATARSKCTPSCPGPQIAVMHMGWHGTTKSFRFTSDLYATRFAAANRKQLVNVSIELRRLIDTHDEADSARRIDLRPEPPVPLTHADGGAGYVYILVNPAMPGLVKIGLTTNTPEERAKELSRATGVPYPYAVVHSEHVPDCAATERRVHRRLVQQRGNPRREHFDMPVADAIAIVREIAEVDRRRVVGEGARPQRDEAVVTLDAWDRSSPTDSGPGVPQDEATEPFAEPAATQQWQPKSHPSALTAGFTADASEQPRKPRSRVVPIGVSTVAAGVAVAAFAMMRSNPHASRRVAARNTIPASTTSATACPAGMIFIAGGSFSMGSPDGYGSADEHPAHQVTVSAFCMDTTEVTVAAYASCFRSGRCLPPQTGGSCNAGRSDRQNHPINCVSWDQAVAFCATSGKRLPTEAEWEFAARGADGREFPWGDDPPTSQRLNACGAECPLGQRESLFTDSDGWSETAPVGSYPAGATPSGLFDMAGNVWEWVADWLGPYSEEAAADSTGPSRGNLRVYRGGGWGSRLPADVRSMRRRADPPSHTDDSLGFRCAR